MSEVISAFIDSGRTLDEIVAGSPVDWKEVPVGNRYKVATVLIHCCVNGPVSPNKVTVYPTLGECSLNELVGDQKITNRGLRKTCEVVAKELHAIGFSKGFQVSRGDFWPLNSEE